MRLALSWLDHEDRELWLSDLGDGRAEIWHNNTFLHVSWETFGRLLAMKLIELSPGRDDRYRMSPKGKAVLKEGEG